MANVRELNRKVGSLRNMQKVMRAMNMIASTKLRKILGRHPALIAFEKTAREMAGEVALAMRKVDYPLITQTADPERICIVLFTSDKGLCGSHNNAAQRAAAALMESKMAENIDVDTVCIGNRGAAFCRRNHYDIYLSAESSDRSFTDKDLLEITQKLISRVLQGEIQQVYFVFNAFISTLQQMTESMQILPLDCFIPEDQAEPFPDFMVEPGGPNFARDSVHRILFCLLQIALRHSHLSEHASRMTAMDNATNNSEDLIARYGAVRNRARQAQITSELTEIVAGKEALK